MRKAEIIQKEISKTSFEIENKENSKRRHFIEYSLNTKLQLKHKRELELLYSRLSDLKIEKVEVLEQEEQKKYQRELDSDKLKLSKLNWRLEIIRGIILVVTSVVIAVILSYFNLPN